MTGCVMKQPAISQCVHSLFTDLRQDFAGLVRKNGAGSGEWVRIAGTGRVLTDLAARDPPGIALSAGSPRLVAKGNFLEDFYACRSESRKFGRKRRTKAELPVYTTDIRVIPP